MDPFSENYCEKCPRQCSLIQNQIEVAEAKDDTVDFVSAALMGETGTKLDTLIENLHEVNPLIDTSLKQDIRKQYADEIAAHDAEYERLETLRRQLALSCSNPLTMQTTKNDLKITVTVCTSRHPENINASETHKPTHTTIRRL